MSRKFTVALLFRRATRTASYSANGSAIPHSSYRVLTL